MAAEPTIAVLSIAPDGWRNGAVLLYAAMADYWALTKPGVNFLIAITTFAGWYFPLLPCSFLSATRFSSAALEIDIDQEVEGLSLLKKDKGGKESNNGTPKKIQGIAIRSLFRTVYF